MLPCNSFYCNTLTLELKLSLMYNKQTKLKRFIRMAIIKNAYTYKIYYITGRCLTGVLNDNITI